MKKTLLIAAAALAAGIISSQAQVYSQNVVGYANVKTPNGGTYLITVPFQVGVSNGANEVWPLVGGQPTIPDFSQVLIWNGAGYNAYYSDSTSPTLWDDTSFNNVPAPKLPVGQGFFMVPSGDTTNTFVGAIAVNVGSSNSMVLPNGGTYLVASVVPYAGSVTNGNVTTKVGGPGLSSLNGLPDFSQVLIWNGAGYNSYYSDSTSPTLYDDTSFNNVPAPTVNVGQGFFLIPSDNFTWKVGL